MACRRSRSSQDFQLVRILDGELAQQDLVHQGKDRGVRANAESECDYGYRGESRALRQHAQAEGDVFPQIVHYAPTVEFMPLICCAQVLDVSRNAPVEEEAEYRYRLEDIEGISFPKGDEI